MLNSYYSTILIFNLKKRNYFSKLIVVALRFYLIPLMKKIYILQRQTFVKNQRLIFIKNY